MADAVGSTPTWLSKGGGVRTFEFRDFWSHEFWNIELRGRSCLVSFGNVGEQGQTERQEFPGMAATRAAYEGLIKEKLARGYVETTPKPTEPGPLQQALEASLAENPDDLATHGAYADYLMEQGDPRGEFIQVQLALEDPARSPTERKHLQAREAELLQTYQREWLGELAQELLDEHDVLTDWGEPLNSSTGRWARGWLEDVHVRWLDLPLARRLAREPAARFLRRLQIDEADYTRDYEAEPNDGIPEGSECPCLCPLARAPFLPCLRVFQLGETVDFGEESYNCRTYGEGVAGLVARMTRLEELYLFAHDAETGYIFALPNLGHLRVLVVYHEDAYPLEVLAVNPTLGKLTTLRLHPRHTWHGHPSRLPRERVRDLLRSPHLVALTHLYLHGSDMGNIGCVDIVQSGILKRLKVLDLSFGCVGDEGARILAACPDVRRLERLSLAHNELTDAGRALLAGLGIEVDCGSQYQPGSNDYLYSGDME
jgi:uncharacterized protein (TIGR02996 family)